MAAAWFKASLLYSMVNGLTLCIFIREQTKAALLEILVDTIVLNDSNTSSTFKNSNKRQFVANEPFKYSQKNKPSL